MWSSFLAHITARLGLDVGGRHLSRKGIRGSKTPKGLRSVLVLLNRVVRGGLDSRNKYGRTRCRLRVRVRVMVMVVYGGGNGVKATISG